MKPKNNAANTNESTDGKLQEDWKGGFWKLVDLTVLQSVLLLLVTFDIMLERYEAVILPFTSNFFVNLTFHSEIQGCVIGDMKQWLNRQPWHSPFKVIIRHNFGKDSKNISKRLD